MTAILLDGVATAETVLAGVAERAAAFAVASGRRPGLGTLLVGDDSASASYVAKKHAACERCAMASVSVQLPATATQAVTFEARHHRCAPNRLHVATVTLPSELARRADRS